MADIFLSYASGDRERVRKLVESLERQGWSVWWDRRILPGQNWDDLIAGELEAAKCIVVVWTLTSVLSEWVRLEANAGRERGILAPVLLDEVSLPLTFRHLQTALLARWNGDERVPEIEALFAGIQAILEKRATPAGPPPPVVEDRALDAALPREMPIQKAANLIAMIRCSGSAGLKAILETDDEFGLSSEDVVSKRFEISFTTDAAGRPVPAEVLLRLVSPEFRPPEQEKRILVRTERDSTICSFLMTPVAAGELTVQLELYVRETCLASRILRANALPAGRPVTLQGHHLVSMPLHVNVGPAEFTKFSQASAPASPPAPLPTAADRPQTPQMPSPARSDAPLSPKKSGAVWLKAGIAAAVLLLCVPIIQYQIVLQRRSPGSIELPSVTSPQPQGTGAPAGSNDPAPAPPQPKVRPQQPAPAEVQRPPRPTQSREIILLSSAEQLAELRRRARGIRGDLASVRKRLEAQGRSVSTDILAAERRMEAALNQASAASKAGDAERMQKSVEEAKKAIVSIEEFLGR